MSADEERIERWLTARDFAPPGKLIDTIPIQRIPADSPAYETIACVEQFQHWAQYEAYLLPGEYPYQAWLGSILGFYAGQIDNGGHDQWIANLRFNDLHIDAVGFGLELLGLEDYRAIWRRYSDYARPASTRAALRERWGFGKRDEASNKLDKEFFQLGSERLVSTVASWLRAGGALRAMTPDELKAEQTRIIELNEAWAERKAQAERDREARDPLAAIVRSLCQKAGAIPEKVVLGDERPIVKHAGKAVSQLIWFIKSNRGLLIIVVTPPKLLAPAIAHLGKYEISKDPLILTKMNLAKAQYQTIADYFAI